METQRRKADNIEQRRRIVSAIHARSKSYEFLKPCRTYNKERKSWKAGGRTGEEQKKTPTIWMAFQGLLKLPKDVQQLDLDNTQNDSALRKAETKACSNLVSKQGQQCLIS